MRTLLEVNPNANSNRGESMFKQFQRLGKAFMLPISILPVAGLLLGLGGSLTNVNTIAAYPVLGIPWLQTILQIMNAAGGAVFANLPLIFAIGLAVGLAEADKGTAGLAGGVAYLVFTATIAGLAGLFLAEGTVLDTGVLGALVIGIVVSILHNKYRNIQLPQFLGFFGGSRFIPIVSSLTAILIGGAFFIIWPTFQNWLVIAGQAIAKMGYIGTFLYGFLLRLTGAVGLHHTIYPMFWYTELGGVEAVAGQQIAGAQNIFFAQLADPNHTGLFTHGTKYFAGRFATMMFGLPAACLAMLHSIPKERRNSFRGLYAGNALTSFLTGITEPIEYMFLFAAPWLYVIHAFLDGLSFMVADILSIRIGNTFSGGFIDFTLFGILQGNSKTHWVTVLIMGAVWAAVYYLVFRFAISKFHVAIPGSDESMSEDGSSETPKASSSDELSVKAAAIITALGGPDNLEDVDACITRLRVSVKDSSLVKDNELKKQGAAAVLKVKDGVQAVFGTRSDLIKEEILKQLNREN